MMRAASRAAAVLGVALNLAAAGAQQVPAINALQPEALFARVSPNVWVLQTTDAHGQPLATGTAVATGRGTAVTSCHLLAKASSVSLRRENISYGASLAFPDVERGLCQLRIANFEADSLALRETGSLQVGTTLYLIGAPRGRELTLGVGMLAGVRRAASGDVEALQLATSPDAGLEGAGLFDAQGRLVGLLGGASPGATSPPLAMPAGWIAELPARGRAAIANMGAQPAFEAGAPKTIAAARVRRPVLIEYELQDRLTGTRRKAVYRTDGGADELLSFNGGGWVEKPSGEVVSITSSVAGEFDSVMPPGGWVPANPTQLMSWHARYVSTIGASRIGMELTAVVTGAARITVAGRELDTVRIEYRGYTDRMAVTLSSGGSQSGRYRAEIWYSPELGRPVRFEMSTRGGTSGGAFVISESLELVSIR